MKLRNRQSGMSVVGMLIIAVMVGFFAMCAMRMIPPYMEYLTVKKIVSETAAEFNAGEGTIPDLRRRIGILFNTNQIYDLSPQDVKVYRKEGNTYIDASYEVRIPIAGRIDSVMNFDDLKYVVGEPLTN
jgi:hypothetical protein